MPDITPDNLSIRYADYRPLSDSTCRALTMAMSRVASKVATISLVGCGPVDVFVERHGASLTVTYTGPTGHHAITESIGQYRREPWHFKRRALAHMAGFVQATAHRFPWYAATLQ